MSGPPPPPPTTTTTNNDNSDLVAAVAEVNRAAADAAGSLPSSLPTPVLVTYGDATATATGTEAQGAGRGRGAFIVLEGLDRSGKTTQVRRLQSRLAGRGKGVELLRFPDRTTPTGQIINQYLSSSTTLPDQSIHLLFTANRWESAPTITSLLAQGKTIICDRYYYSGMVYSAAKDNPSLTLPWARAPEVGLPRPDLVVFLDLSEEAAAARGGFGEERYETSEMQRRVRALFWGLKEGRVDVGGAEVAFGEEGEDLVVVDAGGSVDEVSEKIWSIVGPRVEEVEGGSLGSEVRRVS